MFYNPKELPISVDVSNRVIQDTLIKQRATFTGITISPGLDNNETRVTLTTRVDLFANNAGKYGDILSGFGVSSYEVPLYADNSCAVYFNTADPADPRNGEILENRGFKDRLTWEEELALRPEPVMLQGSFFRMLMGTAQVIESLIMAEILRADSPEHNKFNGATPAQIAQALA